MTSQPSASAPIAGLSHVQLLVRDVEASAVWYSAALGLEPYAGDVELDYVALRHRASKVVVVLSRRPPTEPTGAPGPPSEALDHLAFAVPDGDALGRWADHLTEIGITHPGIVLENGNPSLQLRDPDGIAVELVAPRAHPAPH